MIAIIKEFQTNRIKFFRGIILAFYIAGVIGLSIPIVSPYFLMMTPFTLILSLGILMVFHTDWNRSFLLFAILTMLIGYLSEVSGIHTSFPYGNYAYGKTLGTQLFEVPLVIGVNWLLLVYTSGNFFSTRIKNDWLAAITASILMVAIDFLIEPVAIKLDYWSWQGDIIPLSNYIGWFFVSFSIHIIYRKSVFQKSNRISSFLLISMVLFFMALNFVPL